MKLLVSAVVKQHSKSTPEFKKRFDTYTHQCLQDPDHRREIHSLQNLGLDWNPHNTQHPLWYFWSAKTQNYNIYWSQHSRCLCMHHYCTGNIWGVQQGLLHLLLNTHTHKKNNLLSCKKFGSILHFPKHHTFSSLYNHDIMISLHTMSAMSLVCVRY